MFPHTITIFHHEVINGEDVYTKYIVTDVYWFGSNGITASGKGTESADAVTVITSAEQARNRHTRWNVDINDRIVKGVHQSINSFKDLNNVENVITVLSIEENILNSDVDNITIKGK